MTDHGTASWRLPITMRTVSRLLVGMLVVIIVLVVLIQNRLMTSTTTQLRGTDLGGTTAPAFQLVDQTGVTVSLASLHGHPVALTFLFTHCQTLCPLTAEKLRMTAEQLGSHAGSVRWIAISVDPSGDTPQSATTFVAAHGLTGKLHFLLGNATQLSPIWHAYFEAVQAQLNAQTNSTTIMHGVGVFVIDGQGRERAFLDNSFAPSALAFDLRVLLAVNTQAPA